jgi:hypothetical protein
MEPNMRKFLILTTFAAAVVVASGLMAQAQQGYGPGWMMGQSYGPGMMGGGYGPGYGPGMMGGGYGPGYGPGMMGGGYGPGWGMMGGGYGPGYGPGMMYGQGYANQGDMKLTISQVKNYLSQMIRNPNLSVGDVKEKDADTIVADVVTKQGGSLVQRLQFNRHTGFVQPEQ